MRQWKAVIAVAAVILFGGGFWVRAQVQPPVGSTPTIFSGADVGFRVERWEGDTPVGRWVVRNGGKWIEPKTTMGTRRLTSH
jgi:hypothetical protein